jgi:hypothetical protein
MPNEKQNGLLGIRPTTRSVKIFSGNTSTLRNDCGRLTQYRKAVSAMSSCAQTLKAVGPPFIGIVRARLLSLIIRSRIAVERRARRYVGVQLDVMSQLVVIHLRWLEKTTDLHGALALQLLCLCGCLFAFFSEQLGVVA